MPRFLALALACGCFSAPREDPLVIAQGKVHALMESSGSAGALDQWRELGLQIIGRYRDQISEESFADLEAAVRETLAVERLEAAIEKDLAASYDAQAVATARRFYDSELGQRIVAAEQALSDPDQREDLEKFSQDLQTHPPRAIRHDLAVRLDVAMRSSADLVEMRLLLRREMGRDAEAYLQKTDSLEPTATPISQTADLPMRSAMRTQVVSALLFAHRDLSFDELLRYVDFTESRAGRWFFRKLGDAVESALRAATRDLEADLEARLAKREQAKPPAVQASSPETSEPPAEPPAD